MRGESRAGVSDWTTARQPAPSLAGLLVPGTRLLARDSWRQVAPGSRRPAGGAGATGSPRPRPPNPTRDFGLTGSLDPERPAPQIAATLRAGLEREQPVAEMGGDLSAGDKQAINSGAKFPSAGPATTGPAHVPGASRAASRRLPGAQRAHPLSCTREAAKTRAPLADSPRNTHSGGGTARSEARTAATLPDVRLLDPKGGQRPTECAGLAGKGEGASGAAFSPFLVPPSCVTLGKTSP